MTDLEMALRSLKLMQELIGPLLHDVHSNEDLVTIGRAYLEQQDDTVDVALILARMFCIHLVSISMMAGDPAECGYYHLLLSDYEQLIASLN